MRHSLTEEDNETQPEGNEIQPDRGGYQTALRREKRHTRPSVLSLTGSGLLYMRKVHDTRCRALIYKKKLEADLRSCQRNFQICNR